MKYCVLLIAFVGLNSMKLFSQQDEQSSLYMFNPLHYNAAYAGSRECLSAVGIARAQWVGIEGAPISQFVSVHSPFKVKNMALGLNIANDKIGARNRTAVFANYAYTLRFKDDSKLNIGLSAGADMMSINYAQLIATDPDETDFLTNFNQAKFNIGTGLYYYKSNFYAGLSIPRLLTTKFEQNSVVLSSNYTKQHFFITTGYVHKINTIFDFKPSVLIKMTANAPITVDLNASVFYRKMFWGGIMYRLHESIGLNFAYQYKESMMIGYAYDFQINGLSSVRNMGSHEVMFCYDLNPKNKSFGSPRYF